MISEQNKYDETYPPYSSFSNREKEGLYKAIFILIKDKS
jgi:hypothetical protein